MTPQPISDAPEGGRGSPQLQSLLERVRATTSGDRELDARIHVSTTDYSRWSLGDTNPLVVEAVPNGDGWVAIRQGSVVRADGPVPTYTSSLDAALGLCERVLPGCCVSVFRLLSKRPQARVITDFCEGDDEIYDWHDAEAPTPALAVCAAMLEALSAQAADTTDAGHA